MYRRKAIVRRLSSRGVRPRWSRGFFEPGHHPEQRGLCQDGGGVLALWLGFRAPQAEPPGFVVSDGEVFNIEGNHF